jgi:hypothetical protein
VVVGAVVGSGWKDVVIPIAGVNTVPPMVDNVDVSITVTAISVEGPPGKMENKGEFSVAITVRSSIANMKTSIQKSGLDC